MGGIARLFVIFISLLAFIYGIFEVDKYLKNEDFITKKVAQLRHENAPLD